MFGLPTTGVTISVRGTAADQLTCYPYPRNRTNCDEAAAARL
jgi:hypothetical protein